MLKRQYANTLREQLKQYMEEEIDVYIDFGSSDNKIGAGPIKVIKKDFIVLDDFEEGDYVIPLQSINMISKDIKDIKEQREIYKK